MLFCLSPRSMWRVLGLISREVGLHRDQCRIESRHRSRTSTLKSRRTGSQLSSTMPLRLAILTISDAGSSGQRADGSGDLIAGWAKERGYTLAERALVPDETGRITSVLTEWSDGNRADVILTTGGTG